MNRNLSNTVRQLSELAKQYKIKKSTFKAMETTDHQSSDALIAFLFQKCIANELRFEDNLYSG